jgi:outer membrane murein-binding lipoprotein Lpp
MKPSVLVLILVIAAVALGTFLIIGITENDETDQLEQNQPTQTPTPSGRQ